jgi:CheY-like chemotaxis protein
MKTLLIADDLPDQLEFLELVLRRGDCRLLRAPDGATALGLARRERPDLLLFDVEMPGLSGTEACRLLKAEAPAPPIVLISAHDRSGDAARCGADLFLRKPVDEPGLLEVVQRFLGLPARSELRMDVDWPATLWKEGASQSGRVRDVSRTGFFLDCAVLHPIGSRVGFSFPPAAAGGANARQLFGEAIVVRWETGDQTGMGCRFFRFPQSGRGFLESFLLASGNGAAPRG